MKKILMIFGALTLCFNSLEYNINAQDDDNTVCYFVEDENGELIEVCEEKPAPYIYCTPECWNA